MTTTGRAVSYLKRIFALERSKFDVHRALLLLAELLVLLVATWALDVPLYFYSLAFGTLFVGLLPHFAGFSAEGERVLWTLAGCGVAVVLMGVSRLFKKSGKGGGGQKAPGGGAAPAG